MYMLCSLRAKFNSPLAQNIRASRSIYSCIYGLSDMNVLLGSSPSVFPLSLAGVCSPSTGNIKVSCIRVSCPICSHTPGVGTLASLLGQQPDCQGHLGRLVEACFSRCSCTHRSNRFVLTGSRKRRLP